MMKDLLKVGLLAILLALGKGEAFGQYPWTKDTRNPILSGGAVGTWNHSVNYPCVLYNVDSLRYEMWFSAWSGMTPDGRPHFVGFATSPDGINWNMYPTAVLSPTPNTWDAYTVEGATVTRENGQYKMWYSSYFNVSPTYPGYLGYATSPDGIHWTKYSGNPVLGPGTSAWEAGGPYTCAVIPFQGGYKMWYAGWDVYSTFTCIGYATSSDGLSWKRDAAHNPVVKNGLFGEWDHAQVYGPHVIQLGNVYHMWYLGNPGSGGSIGYALCSDSGITWTKYAVNPVLSYSPGTWDASMVVPGSVLLRSTRDSLDMWYSGGVSSIGIRIGHATAPYALYVRLDAPADGADLKSSSYRLRWNHTAIPAAGYHLQLASDSLFAQLLIDESTLTDTSYLTSGIPIGVYWWRVRARDVDRWGEFSSVRRATVIDGINDDRDVPEVYALEQNYPNPFNPSTVVSYQLPAVSDVRLAVYDILGREVALLVNERKAPGNYEVRFDGAGLSSGVYFYRLIAGQYFECRKMVLMK